MFKERLFLKMTGAEHNILKVAKTKMNVRSYRELIVTLLEGEYIDYICSSVLTEKALRKIIVNLNQLSPALEKSEAFIELLTQINHTTATISGWNNIRLGPVFSHRDNIKEVQIRLSEDEKTTAASAKRAVGFRTYTELIMHLCCAYIRDDFSLPEPSDYTLFNEVGTSLNKEAKWYNTNRTINIDTLNSILDDIYSLTTELDQKLLALGGRHVS